MSRMCLLIDGLHCEGHVRMGDPECADCAVSLEKELHAQWDKHIGTAPEPWVQIEKVPRE